MSLPSSPRPPDLPAPGPGEIKTEYAIQMHGGGYQTRWDSPKAEEIYPLAQWISGERSNGHRVYRRRIAVVEDWVEVSEP